MWSCNPVGMVIGSDLRTKPTHAVTPNAARDASPTGESGGRVRRMFNSATEAFVTRLARPDVCRVFGYPANTILDSIPIVEKSVDHLNERMKPSVQLRAGSEFFLELAREYPSEKIIEPDGFEGLPHDRWRHLAVPKLNPQAARTGSSRGYWPIPLPPRFRASATRTRRYLSRRVGPNWHRARNGRGEGLQCAENRCTRSAYGPGVHPWPWTHKIGMPSSVCEAPSVVGSHGSPTLWTPTMSAVTHSPSG